MTLIFTAMLLVIVHAQSQNVGIGTTTPNNSALLDLTSISHGLLVPRVTLIAMGTVETNQKGQTEINIDSQLLSQLRVDSYKKQKMYEWTAGMSQETMELKGRKSERNLMQMREIKK